MKKDLHRQINPQISIDESWNRRDTLFIDVRSQEEFSKGTIPGSSNIPLLDNEERETIGILYKHFGRQKAVEEGYSLFIPKLNYFDTSFGKIPKDRTVTVFCARGGMRSQVITSYMRYLGYQACQLEGGYKAYRNWVLDRLKRFRFEKPVIIHGKTGVGKTLVLNRLDNVLDLEGLADHRGSLFGGIGKNPASQKTFEANLLVTLEKLDNTRPVFIEGESRKVGDVSIPATIFQQMQSAVVILLEASIETRVQRTIEEYITRQPENLDSIRSTITLLEKDLGKKNIAMLLRLFDEENYHKCFETILLNYYDKKYSHSMKKLTVAKTINADHLDEACNEIRAFASSL